MRQGVPPARIMALASAKEPRPRPDPHERSTLAISALATLIAGAALWILFRGPPGASWNVVAARWLLGSLTLSTALAATLSALRLRSIAREVPKRRLRIDPLGVWFEAEGVAAPDTARLLDFARPFGVTLLGNRKRDRLVLAVTNAQQAIYFGAHVDPRDRRRYRGMLANASTVSDDDAVLDAAGPGGAPFDLALADLSELLTLLLRADRSAFERCFLSDTHGKPVVLDGAELRIGRLWFDLRSPLQWRAVLFQEPFAAVLPANDRDATGQATAGVMVYQATWVRQGPSEAVLVSLLGPLGPVPTRDSLLVDPGLGPEMADVASAVLRDLRLMRAAAEPPPPSELRVGIEHTFMLRLRAALDGAPSRVA